MAHRLPDGHPRHQPQRPVLRRGLAAAGVPPARIRSRARQGHRQQGDPLRAAPARSCPAKAVHKTALAGRRRVFRASRCFGCREGSRATTFAPLFVRLSREDPYGDRHGGSIHCSLRLARGLA